MCSGLFLFAERTVTGIVYLDMLEEFLMPILEEQCPEDKLFQQDGAPTHFYSEVKDFLNRKFPEKYIGGRVPITWPPRSPDLTRLEFFFCGYIKDAVYVPPLATTLPELAGRLTTCGLKLNTDVISAGPLSPHSTSVKCWSQKYGHITYSNAFICHSCAFQFTSNVTVKWNTFHVYTMKYILFLKINLYLSHHSSHHQIVCFKITAKSYNVSTRTADPRRVKTAQNSQCSKVSNAVFVT
jgi:hypothetical protein